MRRRDRSAEAAGDDGRDVRGEILAATERLLATRRFDELAVADILGEARVSRGSFYFYFGGKAEVLAELVRCAVGAGHQAAEPWLHHDEGPEPDVRAAVRSGIADGARLWRDRAPVLRAIVENWRTDPALAELWQQQMGGYTAVTLARLVRDGVPPGVDPAALAATLTWLGERLYYLAAIGVPPFDDEDALVDTLTHIWMSALYPGGAGAVRD
jgi:AcrR family transcriptional regulator